MLNKFRNWCQSRCCVYHYYNSRYPYLHYNYLKNRLQLFFELDAISCGPSKKKTHERSQNEFKWLGVLTNIYPVKGKSFKPFRRRNLNKIQICYARLTFWSKTPIRVILPILPIWFVSYSQHSVPLNKLPSYMHKQVPWMQSPKYLYSIVVLCGNQDSTLPVSRHLIKYYGSIKPQAKSKLQNFNNLQHFGSVSQERMYISLD